MEESLKGRNLAGIIPITGKDKLTLPGLTAYSRYVMAFWPSSGLYMSVLPLAVILYGLYVMTTQHR